MKALLSNELECEGIFRAYKSSILSLIACLESHFLFYHSNNAILDLYSSSVPKYIIS